jgi:transposase-like protein
MLVFWRSRRTQGDEQEGARHAKEQIVNKLRQGDLELAKGQSIVAVCRQIGITDQTYYRFRREYGGLKIDQAKSKAAGAGESASEASAGECAAAQGDPA